MTVKFLALPSVAIFHWAQDIYEFAEGQQATLELVTDSIFETDTIILGRPTEIPDEHPNFFPHLTVPGPGISGKGGTVV